MKLHTSAVRLSQRSRRTPFALDESTRRPVASPLHDAGIVSVIVPDARSPGSAPFFAASHGYQFPYHDANAPSAPTATLRASRGRGARSVNRIVRLSPAGTTRSNRTRMVSRVALAADVAPSAWTASNRIPSG